MLSSEYGPLRTPPRHSGEADDAEAEGRCRRSADGCCTWRGGAARKHPMRQCLEASTRGVLGRCLSKLGIGVAAARLDAEAGGKSPGHQWKQESAQQREAAGGQWALIVQRGASIGWVGLFFAVPLLTFFLGKRWVGDVPAAVSAAVLLQVMILCYAIATAQAMRASAFSLSFGSFYSPFTHFRLEFSLI